MKINFSGIDCPSCSINLEEHIKKLDFVKDISISFSTKTMFVKFKNDDKENLEALLNHIHKIEKNFSFSISDIEFNKDVERLKDEKINMYISLGLFFIAFFIDKVIYSYLKYDSNLYYYFTPLYLISYAISSYSILKSSFYLIINGNIFNEKVLMSISTLAAICILQFEEAASVMIFYSLGDFFQELSVLKSRKNIKSLLENNQNFVNVFDEEKNITILKNISDIKVGDILYIKAGEKILFDSKIIKGFSDFDTSSISGESKSKTFFENDNILAGIINISNPIYIKVEKSFNESSIYKIMEMIENAAHNKTKLENFITKFSKYYTPIIFTIALFIVIIPPLFFQNLSFRDSLYNGIVILVISCPCALLLSIPLTFFSGIARAAKEGILIKGANIFDAVDEIDTLLIDKTGTLTEGNFKVKAVYEYFSDLNISKDILYRYIYALASSSSHSISKSIVEFIEKKYIVKEIIENEEIYHYINLCDHCGCCHDSNSHINGEEIIINNHSNNGHFIGDKCESHIYNFNNNEENCECLNHKNMKEHNKELLNLKININHIEEIFGLGLKANIDSFDILMGGKNLLIKNNIKIPNIKEDENSNIVHISINSKVVLSLILKDSIKNNTKYALSKIRTKGIKEIIMLTGDNENIAQKVANELKIDKYYANLLPIDKLNILKENQSKNKKVAFIGDGLNDALVISNSNLGIALAKTGQDLTIESADVVFSSDNLLKFYELKNISSKMRTIILQNLIFIFLIKFIVIFLGIFSFMSMWVAVFADVGVSIIAILNSMRMKNINIK